MRRFPPKGPWRHRRRTVLADIARREWLLSVMALAAAGCRRADDRAYARGNTLIVAVRDVSVILPDATDLDFLIFLPLTEENEQGELEGRLAERWEHSADYLENTFYLRRDVRWHDGTPVTAHDVKFSLDLLSHPDVRERPPRQSVTVLDDFAIRIARVGLDGTGIVFWPRHHIVQMELQVLNPGLVSDRLNAGDFEAVFMIQAANLFTQRKYFGNDNPLGYRNPEVVRLIDQAGATADPEEVERIYPALTEIFRADLPLTRLVPFTSTIFAHRRVRGPIALLQVGEGDNIEDLWLEEER